MPTLESSARSVEVEARSGHVISAGGDIPDEVSPEELARRWMPDQKRALDDMKSKLGRALHDRPRNAASSDRRLIRFLYRHGFDSDKAAKSYLDHLAWRKKNHVDEMHDNIVENNWDATMFPHGEEIVSLLPQIPCSFEYFDLRGNPVSIEYYGFRPENLLLIPNEDFLQFFIHLNEYKMLVLDHFSTLAERKAIADARAQGVPLASGWGFQAIRRLTVVRCLKGFRLSTAGLSRLSFLRELVTLSQANYPYSTEHSFIVNTPWVFSVIWSVVKTALSSHSQSKTHILNSNYHSFLSQYVSPENLPPNLRKGEDTDAAKSEVTAVGDSSDFATSNPPTKLPSEATQLFPSQLSDPGGNSNTAPREQVGTDTTVASSSSGPTRPQRPPSDGIAAPRRVVDGEVSTPTNDNPPDENKGEDGGGAGDSVGSLHSTRSSEDASSPFMSWAALTGSVGANADDADGDGVFKPVELPNEVISSLFGTFFAGADNADADADSGRAVVATAEDVPPPAAAGSAAHGTGSEGTGDAVGRVGGREVELADASSEWAVWCHDYFWVKKFAFDSGEHAARAAFESWSSPRILSCKSQEVAQSATMFTSLLDDIRRAMKEHSLPPRAPGDATP